MADRAGVVSKQQTLSARAERLTEAQRQCLRLAYRHMTSKEIAPLLGLSPHSVDAHIRMAMKVLGVDSRREAALVLNEIESAQPAPRRPPVVRYDSVGVSPQAQVAEEQGPAVAYRGDMFRMEASLKRRRNFSFIETSVEQSGSIVAGLHIKEQEGGAVRSSWINPAEYSARKRLLITLLISLLSAMAFATIVSGIAAVSFLFSGAVSPS